MLLWGASFFFGCRNLHWVQASIGANYSRVQLQKGVHSTQPDNPEMLKAAIKEAQAILDHNIKKVDFYSRWQFPLLVGGALLFVTWRITEMIIRTCAK